MFSKILIANRGEIAVRVIRACKEMGIQTVAVYSEADRGALHVVLADEAICIGPAPVSGSYLNQTAIVSAAVLTGCEAIHPGYGLLSENPRFARLCSECGLAFIGPDAEIIEKMGDKDAARRTMRDAGVPVVPGCDVVSSLEEAKQQAEAIGYPLLIKARAGGGGRGIRRVNAPDEVELAYQSATAEAQSAFGDGAVYMEKFLQNVKHVEMQLLCDRYGNVVCLGERECSMQRKNQK
ncbi:MAG: biotin carboxylase N-terminal domain-containing protein, partial [Candidatus Spyradocola sp.]